MSVNNRTKSFIIQLNQSTWNAKILYFKFFVKICYEFQQFILTKTFWIKGSMIYLVNMTTIVYTIRWLNFWKWNLVINRLGDRDKGFVLIFLFRINIYINNYVPKSWVFLDVCTKFPNCLMNWLPRIKHKSQTRRISRI